MGSSRYPGKVLAPLGDRPMLAHVVERTARAELVDMVMIATSSTPEDDPIEAWALENGVMLFRGNLHDVLDRLYQAARSQLADVVIRITADCPFIDPALIDRTVRGLMGYLERQDEIIGQRVPPISHLPPSRLPFDFAANRLPPPWKRTYPIGLDVEACTFDALEYAWENADQPYEREHVMPYLYQHEGVANSVLLHAEADYGQYRWTVDTPQDMAFARAVWERLGNRPFGWRDLLALLQAEPQLQELNANVAHKSVFDVDERRLKG